MSQTAMQMWNYEADIIGHDIVTILQLLKFIKKKTKIGKLLMGTREIMSKRYNRTWYEYVGQVTGHVVYRDRFACVHII